MVGTRFFVLIDCMCMHAAYSPRKAKRSAKVTSFFVVRPRRDIMCPLNAVEKRILLRNVEIAVLGCGVGD